jgi:hypothetical protein
VKEKLLKDIAGLAHLPVLTALIMIKISRIINALAGQGAAIAMMTAIAKKVTIVCFQLKCV